MTNGNVHASVAVAPFRLWSVLYKDWLKPKLKPVILKNVSEPRILRRQTKLILPTREFIGTFTHISYNRTKYNRNIS